MIAKPSPAAAAKGARAFVTVTIKSGIKQWNPETDELEFEGAARLALFEARAAGYGAVSFIRVEEMLTLTDDQSIGYLYMWTFSAGPAPQD